MNKVCSKRLDYDYDLVSGKVNRLYYQSGEPDQFIYRYNYDEDNRLKKALSSTDGLNWSLEAEYKYYKHGPLSRIELGRDFKKVQGMDYAYTLQGWIKGVNASFLDPNRDIGKDGVSGTANANVRKDAFSYTIGYFDGDYKPIGGEAVRFDVKTDDSQTIAAASAYAKKGLFNGNIRFIASDNEKFDKPILMTYGYDQLNRINRMESWQNRVTKGNFTWQRSAPETKWREDVTYDPNGNIKTYLRRDETGLLMDNLVYNYNETGGRLTNNQLASVTEQVTTATTYPDDIEAGNNSFVYDKIGNLTTDVKENTTFAWSVYGKMLSANKAGITTAFGYDPQQNRFKKSTPTATDFYIRDAQGNVLAIYQKKDNNFVWKEQHLYGSSRLGIFAPEVKIQGVYVLDVAALKQSVRTYELINHLGNVLSTITDKGVITSAQDYFPFGLTLASRSFTEGGSVYRYSFNGKENDKETGLIDFENRMYRKNLGKWLSVDPLQKKYPQLSPYNYVGNSPILFIDPNGKEIIIHYMNSKGESLTYTFKNGVKPKTTDAFVQKAYAAITFSMMHDESKTYQSLIKSSNKVNLYYRESQTHSEVKADANGEMIRDYKTNMAVPVVTGSHVDANIYWDPDAALRTTNGGGLSPSTILFHEAVHADRFLGIKTQAELDKLAADGKPSKESGDYDNPEEKRTVDIENKYIDAINKAADEYAKANDCNAQHEGIRKDHRGGLFETVQKIKEALYKTSHVLSITPIDKTVPISGQQTPKPPKTDPK